jgi:methyltransferase (TIGR00027 family)
MDPVQDISDTALWVAVHRARETERPDALFRDPLARRLAGERGERITAALAEGDQYEWPWAMRTLLLDQVIAARVARGTDMVINLAAGLDTRPYRMDLPASLQWVEVDLPGLVAQKDDSLAGERPRCRLERIGMDLADQPKRRALLADLGRRARRVLTVTEGLLIYLPARDVENLATDLAEPPSFEHWATDLASPGLVAMLQKKMGPLLARAKAALQFGPAAGPHFFEPFGWAPVEVHSLFKAAARHRRLPGLLRLLALLPESQGKQGRKPWGAICLLGRRGRRG